MQNDQTTNIAPFDYADFVSIFGERICVNLPKDLKIRGVSTDTRTLSTGNCFVALRGERFDAHTLVNDALEKGAAVALVESRLDAGVMDESAPILVVDDTLGAFGALANFHRRRFSIPVLAVAGSAGKTTTKEMTARLLSEHFEVLKTEGNFNNQVGVPLTLLRLTNAHTAAVVEIGTNEPGEISKLSAIVAPTHGIITNIGKEHLEKLIDENGVEEEETALFRYLAEHGGTAFINRNDERISKYGRSGWISYALADGAIDTDITAVFTLQPSTHPILQIVRHRTDDRVEAHLQSVGITGARNALAAAAVGFGLGMSAEEIRRGLEGFRPETSETGYGRMVAETRELPQNRTITLLNDCYNANPTSMYAALETLQTTAAPRRIALLGDMRELGAASESEHDALIAALKSASWLTLAILIGTEMHKAYLRASAQHETTPKLVYCDTHSEAAQMISVQVQTGDVLLVKGSRGVRLEDVLERLFGQ
jgi:UDP-N-acetylmuramoyl-tripeptide--D-alanyl-D-alanine ligase